MNIAFIVFNKPDTTEAVFNAIRRAKPDKLFVIADAPRRDNPTDAERCALVRKVVEKIDWDCQVYRDYADENMGLQERFSTGLSWVFEHAPDSIILEDDVLPHPSFFRYCSTLLDRYRDDERIMAISGTNFQKGVKHGEYSYYFSKYFHGWGWATWARAWRHYDLYMMDWPEFRDAGWLESWCLTPQEKRYWTYIMNREYEGRIKNWNYCFFYACWTQSGLTILPNVPLVRNIGIGMDTSTHVYSADSWLANISTEDIGEISHPLFIVRNECADRNEFKNVHTPRLARRVYWRFAKLFGYRHPYLT